MKKIILTTLIITGLMVGNANAYIEDVKYNSNEYIFKINDCIGELNCNLDKNKVSLFKGLRAGYIEPEIENLKELKIAVTGLNNNIKNFKIDNNELQNKHNEFVSTLEDLINNLDDGINNKIENSRSGLGEPKISEENTPLTPKQMERNYEDVQNDKSNEKTNASPSAKKTAGITGKVEEGNALLIHSIGECRND